MKFAAIVMVICILATAIPFSAEPATQDAPIAPQELIRVTIRDWTGPGSSTDMLRRIDADGFVTLPWAGKVKIGRLSRDEANRAIEQIYHEKRILHAAKPAIERAALDAAPPKPGPAAAGDPIHVQIWDLEGPGLETRRIETVAEDGTIKLPHVQVKVAGLSDAEIELVIAKAYRDANLIAAAQVAVVRLSDAEADALRAEQE